MFIAIELLVIGVGDGIELRFVIGHQHSFGIAPEIGAGHRDDMNPVPCDELGEVLAELVIRVRRDMMKLVDGNQPVIECLDTELVDSKAEGRMSTDKNLVIAFEECANGFDLAAIVGAWSVTEIPLRFDVPICEKPELAQRFIIEARTD